MRGVLRRFGLAVVALPKKAPVSRAVKGKVHSGVTQV
jgi:hypothetical protein